MEIVQVDSNYINGMAELAYATYLKECFYVSELFTDDYKEVIKKEIAEAAEKCGGVMCIDDGRLIGYLLYNATWEDNGTVNYLLPSWGYGASSEKRTKILSRLFEALADKLCVEGKKINFEVKVYAHDKKIVKLFSMMQFGIQCEECMRSVDTTVTTDNNAKVSVLSRDEINERWPEVWSMLKKLINHLKKSPVFYRGNEFTEEVYKEYLLDEATTLFAVLDNEEIIGIIDANADGSSFITNDKMIFNVGDIYVSEEYRGKGIAQQLLQYANDYLKNQGVSRLWVEHGTANPNARGFWDKYFEPYIYTMIREIER